jgi:hypothetical protein
MMPNVVPTYGSPFQKSIYKLTSKTITKRHHERPHMVHSIIAECHHMENKPIAEWAPVVLIFVVSGLGVLFFSVGHVALDVVAVVEQANQGHGPSGNCSSDRCVEVAIGPNQTKTAEQGDCHPNE